MASTVESDLTSSPIPNKLCAFWERGEEVKSYASLNTQDFVSEFGNTCNYTFIISVPPNLRCFTRHKAIAIDGIEYNCTNNINIPLIFLKSPQ
uniref:CUB domain-containing protein n=1 Tax=Parascaris univalens TaxID=6257 RepID=A0A915BSY3_PARUN